MLPNPERAWYGAAAAKTIDRAEVERRIGPTPEPLEVLTGGLANLNVRVGRDRVLRIGAPSGLAKEATLLRHPWRALRTPRVLATGDDFLLLEFLDLQPLPESAGEQVGRALAEIHARTYATTGSLGADLSLATLFPEDGEESFAARGFGHAMLSEAEPYLAPALAARITAFLDGDAYAARDALDVPVLCHCDFKVSNLHVTPAGELVVLDWEFAWAGPRLLDIGQLLRWQPPETFVRAFADGYLAGGGVLIDGWRRIAEAIDVGSMLGVFAHNEVARSTPDIERRLAEIVAGY
jgi:aminoglycoside phosphotransferase (APT) family kinase protein